MQTQIISMLARRFAFSTHKHRGIWVSVHTVRNQNRIQIQFAMDSRPPVLISLDFLSAENPENPAKKIGNLGLVSSAAQKFNVAGCRADLIRALILYARAYVLHPEMMKKLIRCFADTRDFLRIFHVIFRRLHHANATLGARSFCAKIFAKRSLMSLLSCSYSLLLFLFALLVVLLFVLVLKAAKNEKPSRRLLRIYFCIYSGFLYRILFIYSGPLECIFTSDFSGIWEGTKPNRTERN